ncbi:organelle RRM domain-containing protein 6, chloroplastic [Prosopis cineraria]|uniref:organelle RRM domain-containing protein 6, chloroplastic n=1 Tax=Prosopis cineraria TaxID=364024 RepID=UPI00240F6247|nr:organelle RRM domain-containing protein 6, chloroplastic [Prosopis cineraria]XP_054780563.1 organelle RRM domain-containing protein 6, chloroplastic [Prosopis cineraria]
MLTTTAFSSVFAFRLATVRASESRSTYSFPLKLRASLHDYPLASKIVVKNLSYSSGETILEKEFSNFGEIADVKVVKDTTKRSKGYAFIQYTSQDDAMLAIENMDQKVLDGRKIYVEIAKPGKDAFHGHPKTSGPPKEWQKPDQEEVVDCWY